MFKGGKYLPSGNITDVCPLDDFLPCPQAHVKVLNFFHSQLYYLIKRIYAFYRQLMYSETPKISQGLVLNLLSYILRISLVFFLKYVRKNWLKIFYPSLFNIIQV